MRSAKLTDHIPFLAGSFFGGQADAIAWWRRTYFAYVCLKPFDNSRSKPSTTPRYHDYYIFKRGKFAGKDQTVFTTLFLLFPERFITVWQYDRKSPQYIGVSEGPLGDCGGGWWYYQFFVSSRSDQERMRDVWTPDRHNPASAKFKLRPPNVCRVTRVLSIRDVLRRSFGKFWKFPKATVDTDRSQRL